MATVIVKHRNRGDNGLIADRATRGELLLVGGGATAGPIEDQERAGARPYGPQNAHLRSRHQRPKVVPQQNLSRAYSSAVRAGDS